jgi:hypothetical protein
MDWTVKDFAETNHPPVARLAHSQRLNAISGSRVVLSAAGSSDPDGHLLDYRWIYYPEPSTVPISSARTPFALQIEDADKSSAWFTAPRVSKPETIHIVLAVTDRGVPRLTRYQRVLVTVFPQP